MYSLKGKKVIFFGGSSGMGKAGAIAALEADAVSVILVGRSTEKLENAKAEITRRVAKLTDPDSAVETRVLDMTDETAVASFFENLKAGSFDHMVITAGPSNGTSSIEGSSGFLGLKAQLEMKLLAQLCIISYGAPKLADGGSIVMTSGVLAQRPGKGSTALAIANAGLETAARGLANDLGPRRIRVNVLSPGLTNTEIWDSMPPAKREGMLKGFGSTLPLGRSGEADDMGHGILFLLTSEYVTGLTIQVDGGALIRP